MKPAGAIIMLVAAEILLSGCQGILGGIYDEPGAVSAVTTEGRLLVDATDWGEWHYIDFAALADSTAANPTFDTSSLPVTMPVPLAENQAEGESVVPESAAAGIYTYWFDVFGSGMAHNEFRSFSATAPQPEPERWTIAVHRNNFRTNGCRVAKTSYTSIDELPPGDDWLSGLEFAADEWTESEVWTVKDRMLLGLIGCQGINLNRVLSRCLTMVIPPMPPQYAVDRHVFVISLPDSTYAAFRLDDYMDSAGTACRLSIEYKYPL